MALWSRCRSTADWAMIRSGSVRISCGLVLTLDQDAVLETRSRADEGDELGPGDRAPAGLGAILATALGNVAP